MIVMFVKFLTTGKQLDLNINFKGFKGKNSERVLKNSMFLDFKFEIKGHLKM